MPETECWGCPVFDGFSKQETRAATQKSPREGIPDATLHFWGLGWTPLPPHTPRQLCAGQTNSKLYVKRNPLMRYFSNQIWSSFLSVHQGETPTQECVGQPRQYRRVCVSSMLQTAYHLVPITTCIKKGKHTAYLARCERLWMQYSFTWVTRVKTHCLKWVLISRPLSHYDRYFVRGERN